jgi:hypothetical protein
VLIIRRQLSPDQSREINHLAGGWSFGEGQPNLPADADREWRCYRAGARSLLLQPLLDGGTLLLAIEGLGPAVRGLDSSPPWWPILTRSGRHPRSGGFGAMVFAKPEVMPSPPGGPYGARRRLTITGPLSPEHGNRVSTGPCGDGRAEVGAPPWQDVAEDVQRSGLDNPF